LKDQVFFPCLRNAYSHLGAIPYLFNCKPRLIQFFFSLFCAAYIFFIILLKSFDEAQPFIGYVLLTKLFLNSLLFNITPSQARLWWTEGSYGGV